MTLDCAAAQVFGVRPGKGTPNGTNAAAQLLARVIMHPPTPDESQQGTGPVLDDVDAEEEVAAEVLTDPAEPADPPDAAEPEEPVLPADPTEPALPVDPVDPTKPAEPLVGQRLPLSHATPEQHNVTCASTMLEALQQRIGVLQVLPSPTQIGAVPKSAQRGSTVHTDPILPPPPHPPVPPPAHPSNFPFLKIDDCVVTITTKRSASRPSPMTCVFVEEGFTTNAILSNIAFPQQVKPCSNYCAPERMFRSTPVMRRRSVRSTVPSPFRSLLTFPVTMSLTMPITPRNISRVLIAPSWFTSRFVRT